MFLRSNAGEWNMMPDVVSKHRVYYDANYTFASNAVTNSFASDYYRGIFITNNRKDEVSKNLESFNRFGLMMSSRAAYSVGFDSLFGLKNSWLTFSVSDQFFLSSAFKKDVFELYFRGNKNYESKTADLSGFSLNQFRYQQFSAGFGHQFVREHQHFSFYAGLSFTKGIDLLTISADEAGLFTAEDGSELALNAELELQRSDSSRRTWTSWNGTGMGMDLRFNWTDSSNNQFSVAINNLGFITWNEQSTFVRSDTSFTFTGVDVSELFDFADSVRSEINPDSSLFEPYLRERKEKQISTLMPGQFVVSYTGQLTSKFILNIRADHFWRANYLPSVMISPGFRLPNHTFWLTSRFGGYGKFFAGFAYQFHANTWDIGIRSEYLSGYLMSKGRGQGASFFLSKAF